MNSLNDIISIIDELKSTNSSRAKEHILRKNNQNELLKKILLYTYGDKKFKIQQKTIDKMDFDNKEDDDDMWNHNIFKMLDYLDINNLNNNIVTEVEKLISYYPNDKIQNLILDIIRKDLRCGLNVKGIAKVFPDLIHQHQIMLASKFEGKLKGKVSMSLKMDGIRNTALIENGEIKHISRQGKTVSGLNEINKALRELKLDGYMVDGELIRKNIDNIPSDDNFRLTTKVVNSKSNDKRGLEFVVFDITPIEDYKNNRGVMQYKERLELMDQLIGKGNEFIRLVPRFGITDSVEEIYKQLDKVIADNQEGLMLNTLTGVYGFGKRSKEVLKVKKFSEGDLLVTDIVEGTGKYVNMVGALKCKFIYKGEICECEVGSGLLDSERELLFNNPSLILNKVIVVKFFEISKDSKTGKYSLRFPTINLRYPELIRHV